MQNTGKVTRIERRPNADAPLTLLTKPGAPVMLGAKVGQELLIVPSQSDRVMATVPTRKWRLSR
jgi:hypothetical protein